jgi:signal transduction histidine kinase/ActR/RegA family two-component response regulator
LSVTNRLTDFTPGRRNASAVLAIAPSSERGIGRSRRWGLAAAALGGGIGVMFLSLWLSGSPEGIATASWRCKANTALCLTLLGAAFAQLLSGRGPRWLPAKLVASVAALASATLYQYVAGVDLGIDQLLAHDTRPLEAVAFPNRMSPSAASCFCLLALAALLLTRSRRWLVGLGQACAVITLSICSAALIGYLYSASILYQPLPFLRLSPYTAAACAALVVAVLALRPESGLVRAVTASGVGGYLARRLLPITLLLPVVVGYVLLDTDHHSLLSPPETHALLAVAVSAVMAPTVLFLVLSLDRLERRRLEAEEFLRRASELTSALSRARTVEEVVQATLDGGLPTLGARAGSFLRLTADGLTLHLVGTRGYGPDVVERYREVSVEAPDPIAVAIKQRKAVFLGSPAERAREYPNLPPTKDHSSWAALPLEGNSGPLGAIALSFAADQRFDAATRERARQLAWQCTQALERALLFDSEQQARERAEAASRAKDEFMAMLGHELRNPLSPILTSLHLMDLRDSKESSKEREVIRRQVSHMTRLVDDLLDVSRIASGRIELRRRSMEMSELIKRALELVTPLLEQRRHTVTVEVPARGLSCDVDPERMVQVLANLLTNSAKYTSPGGHVAIRAARDEQARIVTTVTDDGAGISPELLPSVFELFVQGARTLERSQGGLGLGLSLVKSLVELHGGSVAAESEGLGRGSEFRVVLPGVDAPTPDSHPPAPARRPTPNREPRRILLVDDNRDAADSMAQALSEEGHDVRVAYDGPSALGLAKELKPQLAFLDLGLPVMDGYELARRLRAEGQTPELKLVAVTGYGQRADRERSRDAGFDEHLVKPVSVEDLMLVVAGLRQFSPVPQSPPGTAPAA